MRPNNFYCTLAENFADNCHAATNRGRLVGGLLFPRVHRCRALKLLHWGRHSVIVVLGFSQHLALPAFQEDWRSQELSAAQVDHILVRN